jgi:GTP pyrophosphokinase
MPDLSLIRRAYIYASYYHRDQFRLSGEPYIIHPLSVAKILTELKTDDKSVAAGLLHDVAEDTQKTIEDISKHFGDEVAFLVDGVTKISKLDVNLNAEERQIENLRKMFVFMARDVRVILIKIADRLDNIRTIEFLPEEKARKIADETLKIFAPIAHRLGLYNIKTELEDRSFEVLYPNAARYIKNKIKDIISDGRKLIKEIEEYTSSILKKEGIENFKVESRVKGIYSIWNKIVGQGIDIENVYDIIGFRIIVQTVEDCYKVLGILHTYFKPIPGKFKDYIAIPKPNGYKSLHTKVILEGGKRAEFQIRTSEMHKEAEEGIAAHWAYKEKSPISPSGLKIFSWLRSVLELSRENPEYEVKKISQDIYPDEIYVFTPKGDVKILPRGATVLDFAFTIHTDLGLSCVGARVNGKLQPIDYVLRSGDIVEVITSKNQRPKRNWLDFVVTEKARARIKQWLSKGEKQINIETGEEILKRELKKFGLNLNDIIRKGILSKAIASFNLKSIQDLYMYIGAGKIPISSFMRVLKRFIEQDGDQKKQVSAENDNAKETDNTREISQRSPQTFLYGDLKGVQMRFALCCTPVHHDDVVGYITKGYGIVIHRSDCPELTHLDAERIIKIPKDYLPDNIDYISKIKFNIKSFDYLNDVLQVLRRKGFKISEFISREDDGAFQVELKVKVKSKEEVEQIINNLSTMKSVENVSRI